jgi:Cu+-exporting ATPase
MAALEIPMSNHQHANTVPAAVAHPIGTYTCPMHPEVRQQGPGSCPKCGMALEPVVAQATTTTEWTCPMHPEIVRSEPGSCPIAAWRSNRVP